MLDILKIRLTKRYKPLIAAWPITYKCSSKCKYCVIPKGKEPELDTKQCLQLIDTLKKRGTRILVITGGEPTLRKDLQAILKYAKSKGMYLFLSTNGTNFNKGLASLVDKVSLSLDGLERVNDDLRGKGSYARVIESIKTCKDCRVPVSITYVINNKNISQLGNVLRIGKEQRIKVNFQPMMKKQNGILTNSDLMPPKEIMHQAIDYLAKQKKKGAYVGNSVKGLKHFLNYPSGKRITCVSGKIYLRLSPGGYIKSCESNKHTKKTIAEASNKELHRLLNNQSCKQCWSSNLVELSEIYQLRPRAILNTIR